MNGNNSRIPYEKALNDQPQATSKCSNCGWLATASKSIRPAWSQSSGSTCSKHSLTSLSSTLRRGVQGDGPQEARIVPPPRRQRAQRQPPYENFRWPALDKHSQSHGWLEERSGSTLQAMHGVYHREGTAAKVSLPGSQLVSAPQQRDRQKQPGQRAAG